MEKQGEITYYELDYFEAGHTILDKDGYAAPKRTQLQFTGLVENSR